MLQFIILLPLKGTEWADPKSQIVNKSDLILSLGIGCHLLGEQLLNKLRLPLSVVLYNTRIAFKTRSELMLLLSEIREA